MSNTPLHRFELDGKQFAIDPETCFCFECDGISWDVLEHYPHESVNRIYRLLEGKYELKELKEVVGELEWLRATRSILTPAKNDDLLKIYEIERGIKQLTLAISTQAPEPDAPTPPRRWLRPRMAPASRSAGDLARDAILLLFARAGNQKNLLLEFVEEHEIRDATLLGELSAYAFKTAALAGKYLTVAVRVTDIAVPKVPAALDGHAISVKMEFSGNSADYAPAQIGNLSNAVGAHLSRLVKVLGPDMEGVTGRVIVMPRHPKFGDAVRTLDEAGFGVIELEWDGTYVAAPKIEPASMLDSMRQSANYYAQRLLDHHYFKVDPIASLFWRIYTGTPVRRSDPAGTNELAIDASGAIYPSRYLQMVKGCENFKVGSVVDGTLDESALLRFDDVGSLTTPACIVCWARHLCGGGNAAVHHALSGSFRTPYEPWCDNQRSWMAAVVSAFHQLSSAGVHFERVYNALGRREKPSLFMLARAALTMSIGVRPIEEADAEMLTRWENWDESSYFLFNESGVLLGTKYDREMDSLHPRGLDQELVLLRKNGEPFGLLKVRPDRIAGTAHVWIFMRNEADYASESTRKSFRAILKEAGSQQSIRRTLIPAASHEMALQEFLVAIGCTREGALRNALYLHGGYHDVALFSLDVAHL